ncbi:MAG: hypothetical protein JSR95_01960 [Proteobacteria bacterium]|nr:hypothetical protein [Pseudomonadota bacterium]
MGFATPDGEPPDSVPATGDSTCSEAPFSKTLTGEVVLEEEYGDIEARIEFQYQGLIARLEMESVFREGLTSR